ncbi:MAG: sulfatase-like hydrolase/transferase, partial [Firmicutes bacterium]|nr:sulfatase-like hydrolase/transferase [Bacillota bacterium]
MLAVAHAMETDLFVNELMEKLEESGRAEDTVLVFFTDHYCKYMTDTDLVMELKGVSDMDMICHTPCF